MGPNTATFNTFGSGQTGILQISSTALYAFFTSFGMEDGELTWSHEVLGE